MTTTTEGGRKAKDGRKSKPQWFGSTVTAATHGSPDIPHEPFPPTLREAMAPHIEKATKRRRDALEAIRRASSSDYDDLWNQFHDSPLSKEGQFSFDTTRFPLRKAFQAACGVPESMDFTQMHQEPGQKWQLLRHLTEHSDPFQTVYDDFVRQVCCPHLARLYDHCQGEIYYQSFPCLRMVQPGDFSIGPHADVAYGHSPFSTNFYVLLTNINVHQSSAALFLERRPGQEDWHPILGNYGMVKHFAGALCAHWTTENNTHNTRVSLDFRLLPGPLYRSTADGGDLEGGQRDVFRQTEGYYSCCRLSKEGQWERVGERQPPDFRVGFPWTVSNWDKFMAKQQSNNNSKR